MSAPSLANLISEYWVPAIYSKKVVEHTQSKLVVVESFNTDYRDDLRVGSVVYIPVTQAQSAGSVSAGTELTGGDFSTTGKSITVDSWYGARTEVSEMANIQDAAGYLEKSAKSCGYAIAKQLDTAAGALFSTLNGSSVYGSDGQTLTDDMIIAMMETLDESDVPEDDRCIITDPSSRADIFKIDKFVRNDYVRNPVIPTGQLGSIYNMPVKITNNLTAVTAGTGNYGVMAHRDAIAIVVQKEPYVQKIVHELEHEIVIQVKIIYGVAELRDDFGYPFYTRKS